MKDMYWEAMDGIRETVAMQAIRKVIRSKDADKTKLTKVISIVHSYEEDAEKAEWDAERREEEAYQEEQSRAERQEAFENMMRPMNELVKIAKGQG